MKERLWLAGAAPAVDRSAGRDNALNFVRLILAVMVMANHAWDLGKFEPFAIPYLSSFAVDGFFAISGYLILRSRLNLGLIPYLWRRCLRILPAYFAALLLTALVIAPLSTLWSGVVMPWDAAWGYIWKNAGLVERQWGIGDTLTTAPYPISWNGSLWTIAYEFAAYLVVGFGLLVPFVVRRLRPTLAVLYGLAATVAVLQFGLGRLGQVLDPAATRLGLFFLAGMALQQLRPKIPDRLPLALAAGGVVVLTQVFAPYAVYLVLAPLPMAYLLLYLGTTLPTRIGSVNDISYGTYVYAFPVQQLLYVAGAHAWGPWGALCGALCVTLPLSWLSWRLLERRALALRNVGPGRAVGKKVSTTSVG